MTPLSPPAAPRPRIHPGQANYLPTNSASASTSSTRLTDTWRECTKASTTKIATATQMIAKPSHRAGGICSPKISQAIKNCRIGQTYCKMPMVLSGTFADADAKSSNGIAVTGPANAITAA